MFQTTIIHIKNRNTAFAEYCSDTCRRARALYNTANYYIRNTMTGVSKQEDERSEHEAGVLASVKEGIALTNKAREAAYKRKLARGTAKTEPPVPFKEPEAGRWFLNYEVLEGILRNTGNPCYRALPAQVNQKVVRKATGSWKSYFAALKAYKKDPSAFTGKPRIPKYIREDGFTVSFSNQVSSLRELDGKTYLCLSGFDGMFCLGKRHLSGKYVRTEIQPAYGGFRVLITMDVDIAMPEVPEHPSRIIGIDTGVTNLMAAGNNFGAAPFLVDGKHIKTLNQWYNKERARLMSELDKSGIGKSSARLEAISQKRGDRMRDYFYKACHAVCRYAKSLHADVIVIGHNKSQKQDAGMGSRNNQNFVQIPYTKLISILRNTAVKYGIPVIETEESYTSKASIADMDDIPAYKKGDSISHAFSGKRVRRGLYQTKDGHVLNADVNGACNIIRKAYPDAFRDVKDFSYLYKTVDVLGYGEIFMNSGHDTAKEPHKVHRHSRNASYRHHNRWKKKIFYAGLFSAAPAA